MQIAIMIAILLTIATVIIYKINDRFEKKEFLILIGVIFLATIGFLFYESKKDAYLPNMFKNRYEKEFNTTIKSLDYELLNNKLVSSKDEFIYKFVYTVIKDEDEFICQMPNVKINKIKNEYVFTNFSDIKEECLKK